MDPPRKRLGTRLTVNSTSCQRQSVKFGCKETQHFNPVTKPPTPKESAFESQLDSDFGNSFLNQIDKLEQEHAACVGKAKKGKNNLPVDPDERRGDSAGQSKKLTPKVRPVTCTKSLFDQITKGKGQSSVKEDDAAARDSDGQDFKAPKCHQTKKLEKKNMKTPAVSRKLSVGHENQITSPPFVPGRFMSDESFDINEMSLMSIDSPLLVSTPVESKVAVLRPRQENAAVLKMDENQHSHDQSNSKQTSGRDNNRKKNNLFALLSTSNESPKKMETNEIYCTDTQSQDNHGNDLAAGKKLMFFTPEPDGGLKKCPKKPGGQVKDDVVQRLDFRQGRSDSRKLPQPTAEATGGNGNRNGQAGEEDSQGFETSHLSKEEMSSIMTTQKKLELKSWGLPDPVLRKYHEMGITTMFDWQAECLGIPTVLNGGNLVYSAPTSAGKTMVAEILMLKRVLETKKKAIMILPFVSVAREKTIYLQALFQDANIKVDGFMGGQNPTGGFDAVDVAVCTIEKANGLINRLMEAGTLDVLGILVIDELHMVGDSSRGYLLELLLTKVQYMVSRSEKPALDHSTTPNEIQIIGMSATLPNLELLAKWLHADLYKTDFRPVPLTECVKVGTTIYDSKMVKLREIAPPVLFKGDDDHIIPLCLETISGGHAILIFCPTKQRCESLAELVAKEFYGLLRRPWADNEQDLAKASDLLTVQLNQGGLKDVIEQLKRTPVGLDQVLGRLVPFGVAFHHAGLTFDERDIIEGAFRQGIVRVLVATSTLSSGVNLPARRVLIRTPIFHGKIIDVRVYKQMVGRAGRKGVDSEGESILVCKPNEKGKAVTLVKSDLEPIHSCLLVKEGLSASLKRAILEVVVSGVAQTPSDVLNYTKCTMLAASLTVDEQNNQEQPIQECIKFLQDSELIRIQDNQLEDGSKCSQFFPTQLGSAILASSLSPDEGLSVFADLQKARRNFVLDSELHVLYLVTPTYLSDMWSDLDWYQYLVMWESLDPSMKRVAELVGVQERFLHKAISGRVPKKTPQQLRTLGIHLRFYSSLVLNDLVKEMPLTVVGEKYKCNRGTLQVLQQQSATFAGMVTVFCNRLGWHNLELLLSQFQSRLTFGVQRDLCDLVRISLLNGFRARHLFNAGYQTVAALANAEPAEVELVLRKAVPFETKKKMEDEGQWEAEQRKKSHCIWLTGQKGLTEHEAAVLIIKEARELVKKELGLADIQWQGQGRPNDGKKSPNLGSESLVRTPIGPKDSSIQSQAGLVLKDALTGTPLGLTKEYRTDKDILGKKAGASRKRVRKGSIGSVSKRNVQSPVESTAGTSKMKENAPPSENSHPDTRLGGVPGSSRTVEERGTGGHVQDERRLEITKSNCLETSRAQKTTTDSVTKRNGPDGVRRTELGGAASTKGVLRMETELPEQNKVNLERKETFSEPMKKNSEVPVSCNDAQDVNVSPELSDTTPKVGSHGSKDAKSKMVTQSPDLYDGTEEADDSFILNTQTVRLLDSSPFITPRSKGRNRLLNGQGVNRGSGTQEGNVQESSKKRSNLGRHGEKGMPSVKESAEQNGKESVVNPIGEVCGIVQDNTMESKSNSDGKVSSVIDSGSVSNGVGKARMHSGPCGVNTKTKPETNSSVLNSKSMQLKDGDSDHGLSNQKGVNAKSMNGSESLLKGTKTESASSGFPSTGVAGDQNGREAAGVSLHLFPKGADNSDDQELDDFLNIDSQVQSFMLNYCTQPHEKIDGKSSDKHSSDSQKVTPVKQIAENVDLNYFESEDMFADLSPGVELKNLVQNAAVGNSERKLSPDKLELFDSQSQAPLNLQVSFSESPDLLLASVYDRDTGDDLIGSIRAGQKNAFGDGKPKHRQQTPVAGSNDDDKGANHHNDLKDLLGGIDFSDSLSSIHTFKSPGILPRSRCSSPNLEVPVGCLRKPPVAELRSGHQNLGLAEQSHETALPVVKDKVCDKNINACNNELKLGAKLQTDDDVCDNNLSAGTLAILDGFAGARTDKVRRKPPPKSQKLSRPKKRRSSEASDAAGGSDQMSAKCRKTDASLNSSVSIHDDSSDFIPPTPPKDTPKGPNTPRGRGRNTPGRKDSPKFVPRTPCLKHKPLNKKVSQSGVDSPKSIPKTPCLKGKQLNKKVSQSGVNNSKCAGNSGNGERSGNLRGEKSERNSTLVNRGKHREACGPKLDVHDTMDEILVSPGLNRAMDEDVIMDFSDELIGGADSPEPAQNQHEMSLSGVFHSPAENQKAMPCSEADVLPCTNSSFTIIDVASDKKLFKTFLAELKTKKWFAVSLACDIVQTEPAVKPGFGIGAKFTKTKTTTKPPSKKPVDGIAMGDSNQVIVGMSFCWENRDAYYVAFTENVQTCELDESLTPPPITADLSVTYRMQAIRSLFENLPKRTTTAAFDIKEQYRLLSQYCGVILPGSYEDPKVASWLMDPGAKEKTLHGMVTNYLPLESGLLEDIGGGFGTGSIGITTQNPGSGRVRSALEVVLVQKLMEYFRTKLKDDDLYRAYKDVEMPSMVCLSRMELNGIGFSQEECNSQSNIMQAKLTALEDQAYTLAGHQFSLSATDDVAQVLFMELQLPPSGDPDVPYKPPARGRGAGRGKPKYSTCKDILEKLKAFHPLPKVILEWRRITNALTKVVFPLQKEKVFSTVLDMERIHGYCQTHTATGRVAFADPNIQNVPKDFEIEMPGIIGESPPPVAAAVAAPRNRWQRSMGVGFGRQCSKLTTDHVAPNFSVSMRHAFVPFKAGVLVAADYSQLELRMIAHLSKDEKLIKILNGGGDVFKQITAKWKNKTVEEVTAEERQQAKQVCYGMIYGIGAKALAEQLHVGENEAAAFIDSFKAKYTGVRSYLTDTVRKCRDIGYVKTILGRRRYLPGIRDTNVHVKSHAERQAVNTSVQGSAADLVKKAMVMIDKELQKTFPATSHTHRHRTQTEQEFSGQNGRRQSRRILSSQHSPEGAYLVLQLHDELMYEVNQRHVRDVARIIQDCMENALDLTVRFPVKLKKGASWGQLEDFSL